MEKKPIVSVIYENERISIKKQLTILTTSPLSGPRADLWPFYGFLRKRFSLYIKVNLLNVTEQCRCSPMLIFRAWATCGS